MNKFNLSEFKRHTKTLKAVPTKDHYDLASDGRLFTLPYSSSVFGTISPPPGEEEAVIRMDGCGSSERKNFNSEACTSLMVGRSCGLLCKQLVITSRMGLGHDDLIGKPLPLDTMCKLA